MITDIGAEFLPAGAGTYGKDLRIIFPEKAEAEILIPADRVFDRMREVRTSEPYDRFVHNGSPVELHGLDAGTAGGDGPAFEENEMVRLYDSRGIFVGVYRYDPAGKRFRPEKMFYDPDQPDK